MADRPNVPAGFLTLLAAQGVTHFPLLKLELDSGTLYLAGLSFPVDYDGHTWVATRGVGSITPVTETGSGEVTGLEFTLSGVPTEAIEDALTEKFQGRACTLLWAALDQSVSPPALYVDPGAWKGRLDRPVIKRGRNTATITVTAEHPFADWRRPRVWLFNHAHQQRIDPTDNFFLGSEQYRQKDIILFSKQVLLRAARS